MTNAFQRFLIDPKNKGLIWKIVKLYHPTIPETYINRRGQAKNTLDKIEVYLKYDWVCITHKQQIREGQIEIGIQCDEQPRFWGPGIKLSQFQEKLDNKMVVIRAWRFANDSYYRRFESAPGEMMGNNPDVQPLLLNAGCPLPTAQEMYDYYYED